MWSVNTGDGLSVLEFVLAAVARRRGGLQVLVVTLDDSELPDRLRGFRRVDLKDWVADGSYESVGIHEPRVAASTAPARPPIPPTPFNELVGAFVRSHPPLAHATVIRSPPPKPETVRLGVAGPRACEPGTEFNAVFACYVDSAKETVRQVLQSLTEPEDRIALDLTPSTAPRWKVGAPVTVRLTGEHLTVTPPQQEFEFNGAYNIVAFAVRVEANIPPTAVLMPCSLTTAISAFASNPWSMCASSALGLDLRVISSPRALSTQPPRRTRRFLQ